MVKFLHGELKYGFYPVVRDVPYVNEKETGIASDESDQASDASSTSSKEKNSAEVAKKSLVSTGSADEVIPESTELLEYRDEANRPWYKFFDELEYSLPAIQRKANKWSWFGPFQTKDEKWTVIKLDLTLAVIAMLAYWSKYLDSVNLNNAYVSGMSEKLNLKGSDLTDIQNITSIGTIIFQLPFLFFLDRIPLVPYLVTVEIIWSFATLGAGFAKNAAQLKACRFIIGMMESNSYLAYQYLIGGFYPTSMSTTRSAIYYLGQAAGSLSSGFLMARIKKDLSGVSGHEGWQWNFFIDCIIGIVIAVLAFFTLPGNSPDKVSSIWLSDTDVQNIRKYNPGYRNKVVDTKDLLSWKSWKKLLLGYKVYVCVLYTTFCWLSSNASSGSYLLWLKSLKRYSVVELNNLSVIPSAIFFALLMLDAFWSDILESKYQAVIISQILNLYGNIVLSVWDVSESLKKSAFYLQMAGWMSAPPVYMQLAAISKHDTTERAQILVISNIFASSWMTITNKLNWDSADAPTYPKGFPFVASIAGILGVSSVIFLYFQKQYDRQHAKSNGIILYNSKTGENYPPSKENI
ncbi:hypothetical protein FOG51_01230 [Hanseniaspora uvarum]|nr:hypothetical protein FOG51_01230 [Hanseniaspora uvarum]KAF0276065.1 hypothetical protein FOG50_03076 [Hanseniaspora uvarum]